MYTKIRKYICVCLCVYVCVDKQGKFSNAFLLLASVWSGNSWNSTHFYFYNFLCAAQGRAVYNCVSMLCVCCFYNNNNKGNIKPNRPMVLEKLAESRSQRRRAEIMCVCVLGGESHTYAWVCVCMCVKLHTLTCCGNWMGTSWHA